MTYAVLFEDNDSHAEMRAKHMGDHLAFLERNAGRIRAAGPLTDTDTGASAGGLWLVEADNPKAVKSLIETDPFWPTGLRKSVRVLQWTQVFANGEKNIR
jgi:uncharacterized protein